MAAGKLAIKARIRSIESTKKITKAMQLVASSKLQKQKKSMQKIIKNYKNVLLNSLNKKQGESLVFFFFCVKFMTFFEKRANKIGTIGFF